MTTFEAAPDTLGQRLLEHGIERRALLVCIAASCPRDAFELSRLIGRPEKAIRADLALLVDDGLVRTHDGVLRAAGAARVIAEAAPEELREIHDGVLAELDAGDPRPATLIALADSGCRDDALLRLLVRVVNEHPGGASATGALSAVARSLGHDADALLLLRAEDAAARGRTELVLVLTDGLVTSASTPTRARAAVLAASAHLQGNRPERATALYRHAGAERIGHDGAWAVMATLGRGDREAAREWRATMGDEGLTSYAAGLTDLADGLLCSVEGTGDDALDLLARSVSALAPLGSDVLLPDTPAALAAIVAISRGEPATAEVLLDRALRAGLGGEAGRRRHLLLASWSLMVRGRLEAADRRLDDLDPGPDLGERDLLLYWCLQAGVARRRNDVTALRAAWREIRDHTLGLSLSLYDLLPLGEMMVVAARLREVERVAPMVASALEILEALGRPTTWAAPLHWCGVKAAFQAEDPAALIPHAKALTQAATMSPYAATLAQAGQTWLDVLCHEADLASVEASVRALSATGHTWDASLLAGQAALRHGDRAGALAMMQLAREMSKDHQRTVRSTPRSSVLTARELDVGRLVLEGQGYRAIGEQLFISPKTVEHHVARIRSRLGASSRGELLEMLHDILAEA